MGRSFSPVVFQSPPRGRLGLPEQPQPNQILQMQQRRLFEAQRNAFRVYITNDGSRIYQKISTDTPATFGVSPVELVFLNYYFWYCRTEGIAQAKIEHYDSNYMRYYIKECIEEPRLGAKADYA